VRDEAERLYVAMLRIRRAEERVAEIYPSDKIQSPVHLSIGQEAVAAGVCLAMAPPDRIFATYRSHGVYIAKGGSLEGMFAELYAKETGCARGKGGSMHLLAPEVGFVAASAIVGSTIPVAVGDALAARHLREGRVSVAFFGDGAVEEGVFFESANFAALKRLPVLFVLENNELAVHTPVRTRRARFDLWRAAEPIGLPGARHDGADVFAVFDATRAALDRIRAGGGPELLEFTTYRLMEHVGPGKDHAEAYRDKESLRRALERDPLDLARRALERDGVPAARFDEWEREIDREVDEAVAFAERAPFPDAGRVTEDVFVDVATPPAPPAAPVSRITYARALRDALDQAMERDARVLVFGIGADDHKAIFGSTAGILAKHGPDRIFDTPLSEAAMTGVAIGAGVAGLRPVHVHIRCDFLYLAMDQLLNLAAKWRYMFGGKGNVPIVVRAVIGRSWGQGAQHSQSLPSFFCHVPGLKVVMPTTPYDAKGLLVAAIDDPNPVVMIEHRLLYYLEGDVPDAPYALEIGPAVVRREGTDVTIVANSYMAVEALQAAAFLAEHGVEAEVVDPVSLVPLDRATILESVRKTGRLVVVDTSWPTCGVSAEIAALAAEEAFDGLRAPVRRLGNLPVTCPVSKPLEEAFYPNARKIARAVFDVLDRPAPAGVMDAPALTTKFKGPF
jgi:2-oxoisovalerate dehydrogenase E1 component